MSPIILAVAYRVRCLKLTNCILNQNISRYGNGGGIYSEDYGDLKLTNSNFTANLAEDGASIFSQSSENILIQHCTFDSNISLYSFGAAISCYESNGPATISHNIITGSEGGSGIYILYADAVIDYNNLWDNPGGDYGGWAWPGEGDISVDPNFIDPGYWDDNATPGDTTDDFWVEGNYHLHYDSSCINAGDPDYTPEPDETDIDGESRIRLGRVDMGADEAGSNPADFDENGVVDIVDYCTLSAAWQTGPADIGWNPLCNISQTTDEMINTLDLAAYCDDWLWQAWWHEQ